MIVYGDINLGNNLKKNWKSIFRKLVSETVHISLSNIANIYKITGTRVYPGQTFHNFRVKKVDRLFLAEIEYYATAYLRLFLVT